MAQDKKNKFKINVLGESHTVTTDQPQGYIHELSDIINRIGSDIKNAYPYIPKRRLNALTLINLADLKHKAEKNKDEVIKERDRLAQEKEKLEEEVNRLKQDNDELLDLLQEVE
ncbi:MAG: cell division protein ZapA [Bacillota bacterium]